MTEKILAICHSMGDSQMAFATAKVLVQQDKEVHILIVGKAALQYFSGLSNIDKALISIHNLDDILPERPVANDILILNPASVEKLDFSPYTAFIAGTPSYSDAAKQSDIPEQILRHFAKQKPSAVVSDYAFYDDKHHLATNRWFDAAKLFLVPFAKAKQMFNPTVTTEVVGHPSIDNLKEKFKGWINEATSRLRRHRIRDNRASDIRAKLKLPTSKKFIFVAAGKAGDEAMIEALASSNSKAEIRIGLHPFADAAYSEKLQGIINRHNAQKNIKILPSNVITSDEAVYVARGVMTVSSTVGTAAAACGKVVGFYQPSSEPYIVAECKDAAVYASSQALVPFFEKVKKAQAQINPALLNGENAASKIAEHMVKLCS